MTSRERILARRSQLVAAALAVSGCRSPQPGPAPVIASTTADAGPPADAAHDGIPDAVDECPEVAGAPDKAGCPPMPCLSIIAESTIAITARIYFAKGSAKIEPASLQVLDAIAEALLDHPKLDLEVRGHVDAGEQPSIALARASAVRDYFVKKGIAPARLPTRDLGKAAPLEKPPSEKNRCVDFEITK